MFAPIFSVLTYKTEEEAIFIANDHDYGLAAAVWTADIHRGTRIASAIVSSVWASVRDATADFFRPSERRYGPHQRRHYSRQCSNAPWWLEEERLWTFQRHRGHPGVHADQGHHDQRGALSPSLPVHTR